MSSPEEVKITEVSKISEVTLSYAKQYMRIDYDDDDQLISTILIAAKHFISSYTGLSIERIDEISDLTIAYLVIITEMYEERQYSGEKFQANRVIEIILDMHSINLL